MTRHVIAEARYPKGAPARIVCTCDEIVEAETPREIERPWSAHRSAAARRDEQEPRAPHVPTPFTAVTSRGYQHNRVKPRA